jgi:hypothetical protein
MEENQTVVPITVDTYIERIHDCSIVWSYRIKHGGTYLQNLSSLSVIALTANIILDVQQFDDTTNAGSVESYILQDETGSADLIYEFLATIDPTNSVDDMTISSPFRQKLKGVACRRLSDSEYFSDAAMFANYMCNVRIALQFDLSSANNALGVGVTNADVNALLADHSVVIYLIGETSS